MKKNAAWLIFCRVAADVLNLLLFVLVSREFGPEGTGMYAYGFAIAGLLHSTTTMGVEKYAIREYTRSEPGHRTRLLQDVLGAQTCVMLVALGALGLFLLLTHPDRATLVCILALTAYQVGNAIALTLFVPAMAEQHMVQQAVSFLASRSFAFVLAGALIVGSEHDLPTALAAFATSGVVIVLLAARSARAHGQPLAIHISRGALRRRTREMWSFASIDLFGQFLARVSVIALSLLVGGSAAGVYATGLKLIEAGLLPLQFIGAAAYPRLCHTFHVEPREFRRLEKRLLTLGAGASVGIAAMMYLIVPHILVPVFGQHYAGTQAIIASMAALALVQAAEIMPGRVMLAADQQVARAGVIAGAAIFCGALNLASVPHWEIGGAIFATTAAYLLVCALYARLLYARVNAAPGLGRAVIREPTL